MKSQGTELDPNRAADRLKPASGAPNSLCQTTIPWCGGGEAKQQTCGGEGAAIYTLPVTDLTAVTEEFVRDAKTFSDLTITCLTSTPLSQWQYESKEFFCYEFAPIYSVLKVKLGLDVNPFEAATNLLHGVGVEVAGGGGNGITGAHV